MAQRTGAIQPPAAIDVISHSPAQTMRIGERLGQLLRAGDLVLLYGTFGVGKTHLIKGVGRGLGVPEADITSPSYVLINEYQAQPGDFPIFHVDLYRLDSGPADLASIGLEECWAGHGLCLIEWPAHAGDLLPAERLDVTLAHLSETKRTIRFAPVGGRAHEIVARLKERAFA